MNGKGTNLEFMFVDWISGIFGTSGMAGMTKTYVSRSWYLVLSRTKLWWPLCVSEPVQTSMFSFFLPGVFLIYCYKVMALCASGLFRVAMMIKMFVSRCWDLNYSRTTFWWALCVSETAPSHLLENYEPFLMPMVYLNSLGLKCWYCLFVYCYIWRLCRLEQIALVRIMKLTVLRC